MDYELTQHASEVILEREIKIQWIDLTLNSPEFIEKDSEDEELEHRFRRIKENGNRVLRVVLNTARKPIRLVTVYFDRTMEKRL